MKTRFISPGSVASAAVFAAITACASPHPATSTDASQLLGTWKVDLRSTPTSAPYFQELVITSVQGKSFAGTFYGAPVTEARLNTDWGAVRLAFVTSDGSGPYNHSAVLVSGKLEGLTNSTGRNFLSYWSAIKRQ